VSIPAAEPERSDATRELAERALVWLLHELGEAAPNIVLLGGLVPALLTSGQTPPAPRHLGTTDVDVLLITHVDIAGESGLHEVEHALKSLGFSDVQDGWRWRGPVDRVPVKFEFLCDVDEHESGAFVRPQGCAELAALNVRGARYVAMDFDERELPGTSAGGDAFSVAVRVAGLGGYLLAKACALRDRALAKDYYDFAYVLIHNRVGGPEKAADLIGSGVLAQELPGLRSVMLEVRERFRKTSDDGPRRFAEESLKVDPALDASRVRADAVTAVSSFMNRLNPA